MPLLKISWPLTVQLPAPESHCGVFTPLVRSLRFLHGGLGSTSPREYALWWWVFEFQGSSALLSACSHGSANPDELTSGSDLFRGRCAAYSPMLTFCNLSCENYCPYTYTIAQRWGENETPDKASFYFYIQLHWILT